MILDLKNLWLIIAALFFMACTNNDTTEPPIELKEFKQEASIQVVWEVNTGKGTGKHLYNLVPLIKGDAIYTADHEGQVSAYRKKDGKLIWKLDTNLPISAGVGDGGDLLYVGTKDGRVVALNSQSGATVWENNVSSEVLSIPEKDLGVVVVRSGDGNIQAFSSTVGEKLWSFKLDVPALSLRGSSTPIVSSGRVIAGSDDGQLIALSLLEGRILWETRIAIPGGESELHSLVDIDHAPLLDQGILYASAFQGRIAAVAADRGQTLWARDKSVHLGLSLDEESLYATDEMSHVWALDRNTGATMWVQEKLHARPITSPVSGAKYVLMADFEGYVHALSKDDGRFIARTRLNNERFIAKPLVENDVFYLFNRKGRLFAIKIV